MSGLTILQPGDPIEAIAGPVGLLFECAPDSHARRNNPHALSLSELIGDFDAVKRRAHDLAIRLLAGEPLLRGIAQLGIFEEVVIRELQYAYHVLHLRLRLTEVGARTCRFSKESRFSRGLAQLNQGTDLKLEIDVAGGRKRSPLARSLANSWQRLAQSRFSGRRVRDELHQVLSRIDPYHRRRALFSRAVRKRGGLWFYSTAYTFTQIGLLYEPHFPERFQFLIENSSTGGRALREAGRPSVDLYEFVSWSMAASKREVDEAADALTAHLNSVPLQGDDALARTMFLTSVFYQTFTRRLLPAGLFSTALFERWVERTRPDAVIVGNPVFEGYLLHAARRQGIPTILLQHGILGDFCQFVDPPADRYVVRGEFWKEFLAPAARERAVVLNPTPTTTTTSADATPSDHRTIVFITAPYAMQECYHESDLDEILRVLVAAAHETGRELVIRVHPLEQVAYYRTRVRDLLTTMPTTPLVTYSQGPGLDDVLGRAAVALMFNSTVFLDCLGHRVPIVSFNWHDFSYRGQIERWSVFRFARDLAHLGALIRDAVAGRLAAFALDAEPFLAQVSAETLRLEFARMVKRRPTSGCP